MPVLCLIVLALSGLWGCGSGGNQITLPAIPIFADDPKITEANFIDEDGNGVDVGDKILLRFDANVYVIGKDLTGILLDKAADTFGVNAVLRQSSPGSLFVEITLGDAPSFSPGPAAPGVSALDIGDDGVSRTEVNIVGTNGHLAAPRDGPVRISVATATPPTMTESHFVDSDASSSVNAGDLIIVGFDKAVTVAGSATVAANFVLPVAGDTFGAAPTLAATSNLATNRSVSITLDTDVFITPENVFSSGALGAGATSGVAVSGAPAGITDTLTAGANTIVAGTTADISTAITGFLCDGRDADITLGNIDAFSPVLTAQGIEDPDGLDYYSGNLTVSGETFAVSLLFVADSANQRVLIFANFPAGNFPLASWVLGQPDLGTSSTSDPAFDEPDAPSASTLRDPSGIAFDAATNRLYVADTGHHRVLVWDQLFELDAALTIEVPSGKAATFVLGQAGFTEGEPNRGSGAPSANSFSSPGGLSSDGSSLAIADTGNHRVVIYGSLLASAVDAPAAVLGQATFGAGLPNQGGVTAAGTMSSPTDVLISSAASVNGSSGVVAVADTGNNRVLVFETNSPGSGVGADVILGQAGPGGSAAGSTAAGLSGPTGVTIVSTGVAVADRGNHRVMVYDNGGALVTGVAGSVVGQAAAPTSTPNRGGAPAANSLSGPRDVAGFVTGATFTLLRSDAANHRVLGYAGLTVPPADPPATLVVGQSDFTSVTPGARRQKFPGDVIRVGPRLVVSDTANHRVLIYNTLPTSGDPDPDVVLGQTDLFSTAENGGGSVSASTLRLPTGLASDGTRLAVADTGNHRVLIWSTISAVTGTAADVVLGQPSAVVSSANAGGFPGANTFHAPEGIFIDLSDRLAVADRDNHRVLIFSGFSGLTGFDSADTVVGQGGFVTNSGNRGSLVDDDTLDSPRDVLISPAARLYVADSENHRVLQWDVTPFNVAGPADAVLGQTDFQRSAEPSSPRDFNFLSPTGLSMDPQGRFLVISDQGQNRVLFFTEDELRSDFVLGQDLFLTGDPNKGSAAPDLSTLSAPRGVFYNGRELYVADSGNSRIVIYR